jgi:hypothetical protein
MHLITPRLDTLPPAQRQLWAEFTDTLPASCVLYGGTALALRTGSRMSEDFDFFTNAPIDALRLPIEIAFLSGATLIDAAPDTATYLVERGAPVKVSFFGNLRLGRVDAFSQASDTRVRIASLLDLAAQKVRVVQVRAERKDYLDLATLFDCGITLPKALGAAQALYPDFAPVITLKALSYFGDGDLSTLPLSVRERLAAAAEAVTLPEPVALVSASLDR